MDHIRFARTYVQILPQVARRETPVLAPEAPEPADTATVRRPAPTEAERSTQLLAQGMMAQQACIVAGGGPLLWTVAGETGKLLVSEAEEIRNGRDHARDLKRSVGTESNALLDSVAERLVPHSTRPHFPWCFLELRRGKELGAGSYCGHVYATSRFIDKFRNDPDALAFGAAHEMAHSERRDSLAQRGRNQLITIFDKGAGYDAMSDLVVGRARELLDASNRQIKHEEEYEADRRGVELMMAAGFNPEGAIRCLETLEKARRGVDEDHPPTAERIARIRQQIQQAGR